MVDAELGKIKLNNEQVEVMNRSYVWNIMQTKEHKLFQQCHLIEDIKLREIVGKILEYTENELLLKLNSLPLQIIHNDANDNNIIIDKNNNNIKIRSIIDFGDIIFAPRICGLAVACAYVINIIYKNDEKEENTNKINNENIEYNNNEIFNQINLMILGYNSVSILTQQEKELLFDLIKTRIATSIIIAHIQTKENPQNNNYLNISQINFRKLIFELTSDKLIIPKLN